MPQILLDAMQAHDERRDREYAESATGFVSSFQTWTMNMLQKDKAASLLTLLQNAHAEQYVGTDDCMPDDCDDWIGNLTDDELCDIVLSVFHQGL